MMSDKTKRKVDVIEEMLTIFSAIQKSPAFTSKEMFFDSRLLGMLLAALAPNKIMEVPAFINNQLLVPLIALIYTAGFIDGVYPETHQRLEELAREYRELETNQEEAHE